MDLVNEIYVKRRTFHARYGEIPNSVVLDYNTFLDLRDSKEFVVQQPVKMEEADPVIFGMDISIAQNVKEKRIVKVGRTE